MRRRRSRPRAIRSFRARCSSSPSSSLVVAEPFAAALSAALAQQMGEKQASHTAAAHQASTDQQALEFVFTFVGSHGNLSLV